MSTNEKGAGSLKRDVKLPRRQAKRRRLPCPRCHQTLSYFIYRRHLKLPTCPGNDSDSKSDSTFSDIESSSSSEFSLVSEMEHHSTEPQIQMSSTSEDSDETCSTSDTSAAELWSDTESLGSEESIQEHDDEVSQVRTMFSVSVSFIQLCFSISDRAITFLLKVVASIFKFLSLKSPDNSTLKKLSERLPQTIYSLRKNVQFDGAVVKYAVCPHCHTLYGEKDYSNGANRQSGWKCDYKEFPNHPQLIRRRMCNTEIMKKVKIGKQLKLKPRRIYPYNSLIDALSRMASRKDFFHQCDHWRKFSTISDGYLSDVYDGRFWKEWLVKDGTPFLRAPGNLLLMMNVDWFRPFERSTYSIGVIYLVIQNLPRTVRFKLENIIVIGAIPGPHEPKYTINSYLKPLVDDLVKLWKGIEVQTPNGILKSRIIRAALPYITCDIPATRKVCGFYGLRAVNGCSKCFKSFHPFSNSFGSNLDYSGYDRDNWNKRNHALHCKTVEQSKDARTKKDRENIEHKVGARYSELLRLPYFDVVRCHMIDPMHNLFLGTAKNMMNIWKDSGLLSSSQFEKIQEAVDVIILPAGVGRSPGKIAAGFSNFTAEQWKTWTIVLSRYVLHGILPTVHFEVWNLFAEACSILCRPIIHQSQVVEADKLLVMFCRKFEVLYGKEKCTPNMHLHCHLLESVLDVGPIYSFWCFSFERYNGILEGMKKTWQAPELQLFTKIINLQAILNMDCVPTTPSVITETFMILKNQKKTQAQEIANPQTLKSHVKCLFSLPSEVSALKEAQYIQQPPIYEKYFSVIENDCLVNVYISLYGAERVVQVPHRYHEYNQMTVLGELHTSRKSRSERSTAIIAVWPSLTGGVLTTRQPRMEDIRVGEIQFFFTHTPTIKDESDLIKTFELPHVMAKVLWYQDHPRKLSRFKHGILLSTTLFDSSTDSTFIPVSRIISRCAILDCHLDLDYGTDHVKVVIPLKKPL